MPELSTDFLRRVADALPTGDLKAEIAALLPYRPETLFGAKATHPDYGDVLVISAHASKGGAVHVAVIDPQDSEDGSDWFQLFLNELTFERPTEAPRVLRTVEELEATALGTVVEGRGIGVAKLTGCNHWQSTNLDRGIGHSSMSAYMPLTVIKEGSDA